MQGEADERASNQEDANSRAYRRIAEAMERDDVDALAAALGQVPDPAWHAPDSHGGQRIDQGGRNKRAGWWSGLRRLMTNLQPRRHI